MFFLDTYDNVGYGEYRNLAQRAKVAAVVSSDAKELKNYLHGVIDTCDKIEKVVSNRASAATAGYVLTLQFIFI